MKSYHKAILVFSYISSLLLPVAMKAASPDSITWFGEMKSTFSGGRNTPFWMVANRYGLSSPRKDFGYVRGGAFLHSDKEKRFSWSAGIDLAGGWRMPSSFYIRQLYGEISYRSLGAMLGSKEINGEFVNRRLSSGDLLFSGNSLPVPQLRAGIFHYTDFPGTKGWLAVKGYISYGVFTDSGWQKSWTAPEFKRSENVWFHSKGLWLRGGNRKRFPLQGELGIEMASQFGGSVYIDGVRYKEKTGFKQFLKAFFPKYSTKEFNGKDNRSVEGNMLGKYDMSISWQPEADWSVRAYFQHLFEDESQMTFEYGWKDGLWGIETRLPDNPFASTIVCEYLHTKDQTGPVLWNSTPEVPEQVSGRDDYYNHHKYGWQHWGMGIGNPLLLSPVYNHDGHLYFYYNRLSSLHLGIEGTPLHSLSYRLLMTFSRTWGTYEYPAADIYDSFYGMIEATWQPSRMKGWYISAAVAGDHGKPLGNSLGVSITIGKSGSLNF